MGDGSVGFLFFVFIKFILWIKVEGQSNGHACLPCGLYIYIYITFIQRQGVDVCGCARGKSAAAGFVGEHDLLIAGPGGLGSIWDNVYVALVFDTCHK